MQVYRDYINKYLFIRILSVILKFSSIYLIGKVLTKSEFNNFSTLNYALFSISQLGGLGLHYYYLKKLKLGVISLNKYISTVFVFYLFTIFCFSAISLKILNLNGVSNLIFILFVVFENVTIEVQRISQIINIEKTLSFLPFFKNLFILFLLSTLQYFLNINSIYVILIYIISTIVSIIILFKNSLSEKIDFDRTLFSNVAFRKSFSYYSIIIVSSLSFFIEKKYIENNFSDFQFYEFNIRLVYLTAICNVIESAILVKFYSKIYEQTMKIRKGLVLLFFAVSLLTSLFVELFLMFFLKINTSLSFNYLLIDILYVLFFLLNYFNNVKLYAIASHKVYRYVNISVYAIYFLSIGMLIFYKAYGLSWLLLLPISTFLVLSIYNIYIKIIKTI